MTPNDGLNPYQRHRLKNLEEFRRKKREYVKTPEQRIKRAAYAKKMNALAPKHPRVLINDGLTKDQRHRLKDVAAYRAKKAAYARTPAEREKRNAYMRKWKAENPEKNLAYVRNRYIRDRAILIPRMRQYYNRSRYGLTTEQAAELKKTTPCGVCGKIKTKMHIDHDHKIKTPSYRGVLCVSCNTKLGWVETVGIDSIQKYLASK